MTDKIKIQKLENGRVGLTTTHNGKYLTFSNYIYEGSYTSVGEAIELDGLARPTMAQIASLVYGTSISRDRYSKGIMDLIKKQLLLAFTRFRHEPGHGDFVYDENSHERFGDLNASELEQELSLEENGVIYSEDRTLRFVPFGYQTGKIEFSDLEKNPLVIALAEEEGAEKLARVAAKHKKSSIFSPGDNRPFLWGSNANIPLTLVSALGSSLDLSGYKLDIHLVKEDERDYCAFGVYERL